MSSSSINNDFLLTLEKNALDSLTHAVEHLSANERDTDLKYTVLHIFHAIELFLKARLSQAGLELIYRNKKIEADGFTVNFGELQNRLKAIGVVLSEQNRDDLKFLQRVRNSIEHHEFAGNYEEIENYVGRAMRFLRVFLYKELGIDLQDELNESTYQALLDAFGSYTEQMSEQAISLHPKDFGVEHDLLLCEKCDEVAVAFPDPTSTDGTIHCFRCEVKYSVRFCLMCTRPILSLIEPGETTVHTFDDLDDCDDGEFCSNCLEQIAERDY